MSLDAALLEQVTRELRADEGRRDAPYDDTTSRPPVLATWVGARGSAMLTPTGGKLTIGVGWNLTDNGLPDEIIDRLFALALAEAERVARKLFLAFDSWTQNRKAAVLNLAYNLGGTRLMKFHETIPLLQTSRWSEAADHIAASLWARQVQASRRDRVIAQIRDG